MENFHGKALGDKGKAAVELLKKSMSNSGPHDLRPQPVTDTVPAVELDAKLSEPPNYKVGQKVLSYSPSVQSFFRGPKFGFFCGLKLSE